MFLKEIMLENFKSFGRKVRLPLQPGYTVVTGPNGSGKSNISDAILFVLGPKSSKVIRAGKLTDLIYNGGKSKNPASFVTVSVIFDNSDRSIPIDADEVTFTRTVKRSNDGEGYTSYFYVNDRRSSLTEFDTLLREAKLSADGYNFVQQGDVTRIIEMGNTERRRILDDIAGITAFDTEIENAERERAQVETNLLTANSVLGELRQELRKLEAEKKAAEKYVAEKKRLEDARFTLAIRKMATSDEELKSINSQIERNTIQINELTEKNESSRLEVRTLVDELGVKDRELNSSGGRESKELREKLDNAKIAKARHTDAAATAGQELDEKKEECKRLRKAVDAAVKGIAEMQSTLDADEAKLKSSQQDNAARRKELQALEKRIGEGDSRAEGIRKEMNRLAVNITSLQSNIRELQLESDRLKDRADRGARELAALEDRKNTKDFEFRDIAWQLKETGKSGKEKEDELKTHQDSFNTKKRQESSLDGALRELESQIKQVTREYERARIQQEAKTDMRLGGGGALRAVMDARDRGEIKGICGTVSDLCSPEEEFQNAVSAAAGQRMQAVIVEDDGVAASCIGMLKRGNLGRLTFLPLNKMLEGRPRGKAVMARSQTMGFIIDHIGFDEKYRAAMWYVFGDTLVVKNIDELRKFMGGIRLVTLDGDIAEASGAMVGGSIDRHARAAPDKGRVEELGAKLRALTTESEQKSAELNAVRSELSSLEEKIRLLKGNMGDGSVAVSALNSQKSQIEKELNALAMEIRKLRDSLAADEGGYNAAAAKLTQLKSEQASLEAQLKARSEELLSDQPKELTEKIQSLRSEIAAADETVHELKVAISANRTGLEYRGREKEQLEEQLSAARERVSALERGIKDDEQAAAALQIEVSALQRMEDELFRSQKALRDQRDAIMQEKIRLESDISQTVERIDTLRDLNISLKTNIVTAEAKRSEIQQEIENLGRAGATKLEGEMTAEKLRETISAAEANITAIGGVNMLAIDNYDHTRSRCESLEGEIGAFTEKKKSLLNLVEEINSKKRTGLLAVFQSINTNFVQVYAQLSGGNEGELVLEDARDPLQGGLLIRVKQKERKTLRIEALSGGEKSLAALAFIFAIQQYDPSPVYFLDEVDMFLDGINSEAVARMVRGLSHTAQFLQISLRKVTLNSADRLIGVTKQLSGVSEIFLRELPEEETAGQPEMQGVVDS
ncbi:MAG: chromosome segregation protein SMC [Thermoplasmata archaeon]|nr:chromosome segregation protein SMC [Candidatus Sysuiplasma acidicola]